MAQRVNKLCPGCHTIFYGSDSAKTCSARCRKRLQRAKAALVNEAETLKDNAEELAHKIEVRIEPPYASEDGYIDLGTKKTDPEISRTALDNDGPREDELSGLHPWSSPPASGRPASTVAGTSPIAVFSNFASKVQEEEPILTPETAPQPAGQSPAVVHHHHHYAQGTHDRRRVAIIATAVVVFAGALFFLTNRTINQTALNQQNQSQAIQHLAQSLGESPIKTQPDATKIDFNVDTVVSNGKKLTATGQVAIQNEADSTHAFTVQNSSGKSVLTTDTTNGRVGIGQDPTGNAALQVKGDITASGAIVSTGGDISLDSSGLKIGGTLVCTVNGCISSAKPAVVQPQTVDLTEVAFLDHDQTLSGNNTFSGDNSFTGSNTFKSATFTGPFQVQSTNGSALIAVNNSKVGVGTTPSGSGAAFQVGGDINVSGAYKVGNNSGANLSCPAGDIIGSPQIIGGIIIGGTCQANLAGAVPSLQQVYNASSNPHVTLNSASGTLTVQDAATPLGINLFVVQDNGGGTKYFAVNTNGVQVVGDVDITGQFKVDGSLLSSSVLADTSNLAKLNADQTFSGANIFSNAANSFTGNGSGLSNVNASQLNGQGSSYYTNASNLTSGNLNDARLSGNVALHNANQTFSGANTFSNSSNSFTGSGSGLTGLNGSNISSGTINDARLSGNVVLKNGNNTFTGANTFALSTGPLQIQDATTPLGTDLFEITDSTGVTKYFAVSATGATLNGYNVCTSIGNCAGTGGDVTTSGGTTNHLAKFTASNGIADSLILDDGTSVTIGGDLAADNITQNGHQVCDTSGNCVGGGGAGSSIGGSGTTNKVALFTAAGTIGDSILSQSGTTVTAGGNINVTGQYQLNGSQVSSSILSNDGNLAKLDADQTFSGANLFNNASNVFVGDGSGLTALNGSNITSGTVGDAYLSNNVALLSANQTFSGANTFSNVSNSFSGDGSNLTNLNATNLTSGTVSDGRLSSSVALRTSLNTFSADNTFNGHLVVWSNGTSVFQVQNSSATDKLFIADTTNDKIGIGTTPSSSGATLQVAGNVSSTTGYVANGSTGSSVTCSSGNVLQNAIITGGIITGGTCVANGAGVSVSLQQAYDSSSPAVITVNSTNGGVAIKDNAAPIGNNLFTVEDNSGSNKYLNVSASGVTTSSLTVANAATVTGATTLNGTVLAKNTADSTSAFQVQNSTGSTILSVDTSNKVMAVNGGATYQTVSYSGGSGFSNSFYTLGSVPNTSFGVNFSVADFNGDGKPDLAMANNAYNTNTMAIYMNNGDGTFASATNYSGTGSTSTPVSADLNGDGKPDLITGQGANEVPCFNTWLNNGDGTFASGSSNICANNGGNNYTGYIGAGDFNGDGKTDMVITETNSTGAIFINNGSGGFSNSSNYFTTDGQSQAIVSTDFNGDGKQDLAILSGSGVVSIFLGNGNGTFQTKVDYTVGSTPRAMALGDFNGDGKQDIAVTNAASTDKTISVLMNNGDGTFAPQAKYTVSSFYNANSIATGDFNGDGKTDIVAATSSCCVSPYFWVFPNNGNGTFGSATQYSTAGADQSLMTGDFNGDGKPDIAAISWSGGSSYKLTIHMNGVTPAYTTHYGAMSINSPNATTTGLVIQGATGQTDDLLRLQGSSGNLLASITSTGSLQVASLDTPSASTMNIGTTNAVNVNVGFAGSTATVTSNLVSVGQSTFKAASNSANAFQIQNAAGLNLLNADTTNMNLNVSGGNLILNGVTPTNLTASAGSNSSGSFSGASGTTYYYKVTAIVNGQETTPSTEASFNSSNFTGLTSPAAPSLALTTGTNLGIGAYGYEITFVTANGETTGGTSASITTTSGNQTVNLSAIPTGPSGTTARKIYRTVVGGSTYKFLTTINDNSTTTYSDVTADGSLGANVPSSNTARTNTNQIYLIWTAVPGATSYKVYRGTTVGGESAYQTSSSPSFTDSGSAGTSATVPTLSPFGRLGIGTSSPTASLDVVGTTLLQSGTNSTTAFQIQNAAGSNVVNVDTANKLLAVNGGASYQTISYTAGSGFSAKVDYATGTNPYSVVTSDLNGDGKPDMVAANINSNTVSVFLNNGDGTFAAKTDYPTGTHPYFIASADLNGDGKPDLAVTNQGANTVSVLLNNGDGTFAAKTDYTTSTSPWSIATADLNGDGKPDLAVTNQGANTVSVLLNNGDGTFAAKTDYATGSNPQSLVAANFGGDTMPDLAVANDSSTTVSVLINNGDGTFATKVDYVTGTNPISVTAGDFNSDGKPDLAVANEGSSTVSIFLNNGDGTFAAKTDYTAGSFPVSVTSANFGGDTKPDLAVANLLSNNVSVFLNNGDGTFAAKTDYATGTRPQTVSSADFNGDTKPDLVVANYTSNTVSVLINGATTVTITHNGTISIAASNATTTGLVIQGAVAQTDDLLHLQDSSGNPLLRVTSAGVLQANSIDSASGSLSVGATNAISINLNQNTVVAANKSFTARGTATFKDVTNSTTAFQVQNSSGVGLIVADTVNSRVSIGSVNSLDSTLEVRGAASSSTQVRLDRADTGDTVTRITADSNGTTLENLTGSLNIVSNTTKIQDAADNTSVFSVQNASGGSLINVDSLNSNITLAGVNSGALGTWQTNVNSLPALRTWHSSITANGYVYVVGGSNNSGGVAQSTVYYAKLNADGSTGAWQTNVNSLPQSREAAGVITANGYIYVIGGSTDGNVGNAQSTVYYAKLNADGSTGAWQTNVNPLPIGWYRGSAVAFNNYAYIIGGDGNGTTVYYAKLNADGSTGIWQSSVNSIPSSRDELGAVVANGYVYAIGGYAGSFQSTVYYAKLNADGSTGAWQTNVNSLPQPRANLTSVTSNGYIYAIAGYNASSVYYAKLNADGSTGAWQTNTNVLPVARANATSLIANGYIYAIGGEDTLGTAYSTVYYTSTSRVQIGANLDLIGLQSSDGSAAGSITAGNITAVGTLQVQGQGNFAQGVGITGNLSVAGQGIFQNAANSTTAFQVQNSSGTALLTADTSGMTITIGGALSVSGNLSVGGYLITNGGMYATSLPVSPVNGQEIYYIADATNGVVWHLRYDTSLRSGSGAWAFLGGSPLQVNVATSESTSSASYADLSTVGPSVTAPLSGNYSVSGGAYINETNNPSTTWGYDIGYVSVNAGSGASDSNAGMFYIPTDGNNNGQPSGASVSIPTTVYSASASSAIKLQYHVTSGKGALNFSNRWISVQPVYVY